MLVLGMIASFNKITNLGFRSKNHTLFETKRAKIDTFLTKTAQNTQTLCGRTNLYSPHKGVPPPPPSSFYHAKHLNELQSSNPKPQLIILSSTST